MEKQLLCCLILLGFLSLIQAFLQCFECQDMPAPYDCDTVVQCAPGDECFLDQFVTTSGYVLYNQGCQSRMMCSTERRRNSDVIRASTDVTTCGECCQSNYCNIQGCNKLAPPRNTRGPYCYSCDVQSGEDRCRTITQCAVNEACWIKNKTSSAGTHVFQTGCIYVPECHSLQSAFIPDTNLTSGTIVIDQCPFCCRDDFCNDNCYHNVTIATTAPPVDGQWSDWSVWSTCTTSCGSGEKTRTRYCNNPEPQNNGHSCVGDNLGFTACSVQNCTVDGHWSVWSVWSSCSATCGSGHQSRRRHCNDPVPQNGGHYCPGASLYTHVCNTHMSCSDDHCTSGFEYDQAIGCYMVSKRNTDYQTAKTYCQAQGASLPIIHDQQTGDNVKNLAEHALGSHFAIWIGIHWDQGHTVWRWDNNDDLTSSDFQNCFSHHWNTGLTDRLCAIKGPDSWLSVHCTGHYSYICVARRPASTLIG